MWGTRERAARRSRSSHAPRAELDFVLVSERIEVTDFHVPDIRLSDHRPLVCDFQVKEAS